jgi:hypothetical protein
VFRSVERAVYAEDLQRELTESRATAGIDDLRSLLQAGDTWTVS